MKEPNANEVMERIREDAHRMSNWSEDWIVNVLWTAGKDMRAIRDGLNRVIRNQELLGTESRVPASLCIGDSVVTQESITRDQVDELATWVFGEVPWPTDAYPTEVAVDINEDGHDGPPIIKVDFEECRLGVERGWSRTFVAKEA